jgi:hypothetical protein
MSLKRNNLSNLPLLNSVFKPVVGTASVPEITSNKAYLRVEDHMMNKKYN